MFLFGKPIVIGIAVAAIVALAIFTSPRERQHPELVPIIAMLMQNIPGDVLHIGHSPFIAAMLEKVSGYNHTIVTIDTDKAKLSKLKPLAPSTRLKHIKRWKQFPAKPPFSAVSVLVCPVRSRMQVLNALAARSYAIVMPHTGIEQVNRFLYGHAYYDTLKGFKYKTTTNMYGGHVHVLSNYMDVARILAQRI